MKWLNKFWNFIRPKTNEEIIEQYLSKSVDHLDLEYRLRKLQTQGLT